MGEVDGDPIGLGIFRDDLAVGAFRKGRRSWITGVAGDRLQRPDGTAILVIGRGRLDMSQKGSEACRSSDQSNCHGKGQSPWKGRNRRASKRTQSLRREPLLGSPFQAFNVDVCDGHHPEPPSRSARPLDPGNKEFVWRCNKSEFCALRQSPGTEAREVDCQAKRGNVVSSR